MNTRGDVAWLLAGDRRIAGAEVRFDSSALHHSATLENLK
jgi:hypothetical protein